EGETSDESGSTTAFGTSTSGPDASGTTTDAGSGAESLTAGGTSSSTTDASSTSTGGSTTTDSDGEGSGTSSDATDGDEEQEGLAFPGARGFGARVTGGRGGRVIKVTTLAASGPGSLQEALNESEPRII